MLQVTGKTQLQAKYTTAVYDSLPPNARVFNQRLNSSSSTSINGLVQTNVSIGDMTVMAGYVFILRSFNVDLLSISGYTGVPNIGATFTINSSTDINPFTQNIWVEPLTGDIETWLIVDQNETIEITASYDYSALVGPVAPFTVTFQPWFFGHMIPKNSLPPQLTYLLKN